MQENIDRYEVRRELGRGGMAAVYLAFDPRFRRQVAIKVMPRQFSFDPRYLEQFQNEAHTIANIEHPAIVPVHDFGEYEDAPFLVMRYMAGGTLQERMSRKPLSVDEVVSILERIAPALDKAHEMGVIHRDLKPANILFDDDGFPYLADFGIARLAEATQTMTVVGTPAYMSPEQVEGDVEPDGRSDIYSLGVMVYELLTGRQPYKGSTPTKQMVAHLMQPLPDILEDNPDLPPHVQQVIEKAMAKDREDRYDTASEMVVDLKAANAATSQKDSPAAAAATAAAASALAGQEEPAITAAPSGEAPQTAGAVTPPPAAPPGAEAAQSGGMPLWIWGIVGITVLVVAILGIRFLLAGNGEDAAEPAPEPAPEVAAAVDDTAATETLVPEPTEEPSTHTPTAEPPTHTPTLEPPTRTPSPEPTAELEAVAAAVDDVDPTATNTATATAAPSETPTATATPEPEVLAPQFVVDFESVNVRRGPSGVFRSIAIRYAGDVLEVLGRNSNGTWFVVALEDGRSGWISSAVGSLENDPLEIPRAATIPPFPTATATNTPTSTPALRGSVTPTVTRLSPPGTISAVETTIPSATE